MVLAQTSAPVTDVLGAHDMSAGGSSTLHSGGGGSCLFCHAPHSGLGGATPLWSQTLSNQTYTTYTSPTSQNTATQPVLGSDSSLCLSCHDGTVAVGTSVPYGSIAMTGADTAQWKSDVLGGGTGNLNGSHPFSLKLPLKDSADLVPSLVASQATADTTGSVKLVGGNVECTTCHNPHVQSIDKLSPNFLVRDNVNGSICLSCHEQGTRIVNGAPNPIAGWPTSIHANTSNTVAGSASFGGYSTVAQFACQSCHVSHNSSNTTGLLRTPATPIAGMDNTTSSCLTCHNGGSVLAPAAPNVGSELIKQSAHPVPAGSNVHAPKEPAVLQNNRHATCVDCHNAHDALQTTSFTATAGIRGSQNGVTGVQAPDGVTVVSPAVNQYENCLRCHGSSSGKQLLTGYMPTRLVAAGDRWNVIPEFDQTATSSHPVTHDSNSPYGQPSLRPYMLNLDGATPNARTLGSSTGSRILCSDCHNSDDNREFGGSGPNGPHGSANAHILERRYEVTQVPSGAGAGGTVQQLWAHPSNAAGGAVPGPYALCAKCHDMTSIMNDASFQPSAKTGRGGHFTHVDYGFSCSACHTAHGMGATSATVSGERLVNFDINVVGTAGTAPISYSRATNTCTLKCHGFTHNSDGTVVAPQ
jgi:predicted CXXCH cytochrome family protein